MKKEIRKTPKLRFPEFTGDWEQRKLGDILEEFSNKSIFEDEYEVLSSTNMGMEKRSGRVSGTSNVGYKIVDNNDLVLSPQNLWLGNININDFGKGLVSPSYKTFKVVGVDTTFVEPQLRLPTMLEAYKNASTQGASVVRRNLELSQFYEIGIKTPSLMEQNKIGEFFCNLSNIITLHQRKLDQMKEYKKGMLQKMFPKKGETVPEVRFPGFTGDWEQRKFGDVGSVSMCKRIFKDETSPDGDIPFFKIGTFGGKPDAFISRELFEDYKTKYSYPDDGDILLSASGTIGRIVEYKGEEAYFQDSNIVWLSHDKTVSNKFLKVLYTTVKWDGIEGSTIQRLYNDNFLRTRFMMPSFEEQEKLGQFFGELENLITLHQRKLDQMKEMKKGLLQQMFV